MHIVGYKKTENLYPLKSTLPGDSSIRSDEKPNQFSLMQEQDITTKEQDPVTSRPKNDWKRWLNYHSIVKQVPFFLFLALLAVIYIYNGHYADKTIRQISRTAKEVKELQWEYKTLKSEVMFRSKLSEVAKAVSPLGLKELTESPVVLKRDEQKEDN